MAMIGALEAGGTKMVLAVYTQDGTEVERISLPTLTPAETVPQMAAFFRKHTIGALGIGSFGPLDLNPASPTYGFITSTPKLPWRNYPLLQGVLDGQNIPALIDTDVNAAILAEIEMGAAKGCQNAVYITIGTGVGGGIYAGGSLVHGMLHPEVGHMLLRPHKDDNLPQGVCPYHESCLEGLAAGPALGRRVDGNAKDLPDDHPVFTLEAHYLAQMCVNLILTLSPEKIILGGGVMQRESLFPLIRQETVRLLGGYVQTKQILENMDDYIVPPALFPVSGLVGSYLLGKKALEAAK